MKKPLPVRPGETEASAIAEVQDAGRELERLVFSHDVAVMQHGLEPSDLGECSTSMGVKIVQYQRLHLC